ncbi:MAG: ABC transporter permease [Actinobacteria bacterium]|nr:ABC transporter permease [Actinomycetota bacterium]
MRRPLQLLAHLLVVTLGAVSLVFVALRITGDPALMIAPPNATEDDLAAIRRDLGLDRPPLVQYLDFLRKVTRGDLGESLRYRRPALELISERAAATLELAGAAQGLALLVAIPLGVLAAVRRSTWIDTLVTMLATAGQSIPYFWLGLMGMVLFGVQLGWLPTSGRGSLSHLILPAVTLSSYSLASLTRLVRSSVVEVTRADYVRTARAKGLGGGVVLFKHTLKNALIPVVTLLGLQVGGLLSGAVIVETVFAWPGIGRLTVEAIHTRDYPLVQAGVLIMALLFVVLNRAVDVGYRWLDPRLRAADA